MTEVFKHEPRGMDEFNGLHGGSFRAFMSGAESLCGVWVSYDTRRQILSLETLRDNASCSLQIQAEQARELARLLLDAATEADGMVNDAYCNVQEDVT